MERKKYFQIFCEPKVSAHLVLFFGTAQRVEHNKAPVKIKWNHVNDMLMSEQDFLIETSFEIAEIAAILQ